MEDLKDKYKPEVLKTVGQPKPNWLYKPEVKPRIWVTKESLKHLKKRNNGKKNK
jgi:hypothetical protein